MYLGNRRVAALLVAVAVLQVNSAAPAVASHERPTRQALPADQIRIVNANAFQPEDNLARHRVVELADRIRSGVTSTDGSVAAPDIITVTELFYTQIDPFVAELNKVFGRGTYRFEGLVWGMRAKYFINVDTMGFIGSKSWTDPCDETRTYQTATLRHKASGDQLEVAGVHFDVSYEEPDCKERNVRTMHRMLADVTSPVILTGDFNMRPTTQDLLCDPSETTEEMEWYSKLTQPDSTGNLYRDTIRVLNRASGDSLADDWTHEWARPKRQCDGALGQKRSRIDYIFSSDEFGILDGGTDNPGWAGDMPGTLHPERCAAHPSCKYSDHRLLWATLRVPFNIRPKLRVLSPQRGTAVRGKSRIEAQGSDFEGEPLSVVWRLGSRRWVPIAPRLADDAMFTSTLDTQEFPDGFHTISVRATDEAGKSSTRQTKILIDNHANVAPRAAFSFSCEGRKCQFRNKSEDGDGAIRGWRWSFGDGATSGREHVNHLFDRRGRYSVTLTVRDNEGAVAKHTRTIEIGR